MNHNEEEEKKEIEVKGFTYLDTAHSNHLKCFICNAAKVRLYKAPAKSIAFAFKYFELVIKTHARICGRHYKDGVTDEICDSQYDRIATTRKLYANQTVALFRTLSEFVSFVVTETIFEPFNNLDRLTEDHCKLITSWSIADFTRFSNFLTSWKKSDGRGKNEIIALYRYYMKKGLSQATIAILRGDTTQRQVSRYLEQMRNCIYNDFVPYFLGISNRSREYFLSHQTPTCRIIFDFDNQKLVICADG